MTGNAQGCHHIHTNVAGEYKSSAEIKTIGHLYFLGKKNAEAYSHFYTTSRDSSLRLSKNQNSFSEHLTGRLPKAQTQSRVQEKTHASNTSITNRIQTTLRMELFAVLPGSNARITNNGRMQFQMKDAVHTLCSKLVVNFVHSMYNIVARKADLTHI